MFYQRKSRMTVRQQQKLFEHFVAETTARAAAMVGGVRKGRQGRGAAGKVPVFGLLKRGGKVYTATIPNAQASTLIPIIREKVMPDSIVYTDSFQVYDVLDVPEFHHRRVNHSKVFVSTRGHHINGIENFWSHAKWHLRRFNGIPKESFYWFLKECD